MAYVSLNDTSLKRRENGTTNKLRESKLMQNERFDLRKGMYGNVYEITDHERKVFYRQDQPIFEQLGLLDEGLPRYCDYCKEFCKEIEMVNYTLVYEMVVRPHTDPTIKRDERNITYASCSNCIELAEEVPSDFLKGYLYKVYKGEKLIWKRNYLHYNGKLTMPWTAIQEG